MRVEYLQRSQTAQDNDEFFHKLMQQIMDDPDQEFIDPIMYTVMQEPVVISTGQILDKNTVLDAQGKLRMKKCPITRKNIEEKVYPQVQLKSKIRDWQIKRFNLII